MSNQADSLLRAALSKAAASLHSQFRSVTKMAKKRILITGAGSGLGEGAAIGLARNGHDVIAAAQTWPQVTALRSKTDKLGIACLRVEKLDLLDSYDVK
jgi:NADP-dependent 3-hydroxy acid dehydrogenase YdfG